MRAKPPASPQESDVLLYQTDDGATRVEVRMAGETVWLNQAQMADLFQSTKQNVGQHIRNVFAEGELAPESVVKDFFTTAADGKQYRTKHYSLDVIISVGYRVKSLRGTQFRIWATQQLRSYLIKGFALDDRRLKEGGSTDRYFDELLERIRDIRSSERMFYRIQATRRRTGIARVRQVSGTPQSYRRRRRISRSCVGHGRKGGQESRHVFREQETEGVKQNDPHYTDRHPHTSSPVLSSTDSEL